MDAINGAVREAAVEATGDDFDAEQATWEATEKHLHPPADAYTWEIARRSLAGVRDQLEAHQAVIAAMVF